MQSRRAQAHAHAHACDWRRCRGAACGAAGTSHTAQVFPEDNAACSRRGSSQGVLAHQTRVRTRMGLGNPRKGARKRRLVEQVRSVECTRLRRRSEGSVHIAPCACLMRQMCTNGMGPAGRHRAAGRLGPAHGRPSVPTDTTSNRIEAAGSNKAAASDADAGAAALLGAATAGLSAAARPPPPPAMRGRCGCPAGAHLHAAQTRCGAVQWPHILSRPRTSHSVSQASSQ